MFSAPYPESFEIRYLSEIRSTYGTIEPTETETAVVHLYRGSSTITVSHIDPSSLQHFYFKRRYHRDQSAHPESQQEEGSLWKCPQWPWIFATMSLLGETSTTSSLFKLNHFLYLMKPFLVLDEEVRGRPPTDRHVIDPPEPGSSVLSKFTAPLFPDPKRNLWKLTMDPKRLEEWQSYVGSVIDY